MNIRPVKNADREEWARMRNLLWPDSLQTYLEEIDVFFSKGAIDIVEAFVLERAPGKLGGFLEINIRNYAEGSDAPQVPYIEGWFVDSDLRGQGYGRQLVDTAEGWALEKGFEELASDAELENLDSLAAHKALGFQETDRIVCFLKKLK